jgi:outer membrane protein assembly factor BamB
LGFSQIIKTIPAPDYSYGLTFDGSYLWVGTSYANSGGDFLWKIDPSDGSVAGNIPVPNPNGFYTVKGLAFTGQNLWVFEDLPSASHPDKFYKVNPSTGAVLDSINSPENNYIGGMTYFDDHIWYSQYYANNTSGRDVIIKMDTTGVPVDTIISVGEQPMGVAYNGQFIWCAEDTGFGATRQEIYEYDPVTGLPTGNFTRNPDNSPRDMTHDGQFFWLIGYHTTNSVIYQFDTKGGTPEINVPVTEIIFPLTEIGLTSLFQFNIINNGDAVLSIDTLEFTNPLFSSNVVSFPVEVPENSSATIEVIFSPTDYGTQTGMMRILSNDPVDPEVNVNLKGKGIFSDPTIAISSSAHNFGNVWIPEDGVAAWHLGIINQGAQNLEIQALDLSNPVFSTDSPPLPFNVPVDDTIEISVSFAPMEAITYRDTLYITSNDTAQTIISVNLQGTGISGPFTLGYQFWNYQVPDNPNTTFNEYRPLALKPIEDVNGDGYHDVVIATRNYWTICLSGASADVAEEIWRFSSYISSFSAGGIGNTNDLPPQQRALAIANDLNNDGFQDVVIGTGGGNEHVYALNGVDGNILWQFGTDHPDSFGLGDFTSVFVDEDFNNDGINDVVATASGSNNGVDGRRTVYCFNGTNGQILWQYFSGGFIRMAVNIGDVNGTGSTDVVEGTGDGIANVYSIVAIEPQGPTGPTPIWDFPIGSAAGGGRELLRYDIENETSDVIAGAYFGMIFRLDGEAGSQIWLFDLGSSGINQLSILEDVNGDGLNEVLVSSFTSTFYCINGADGNVVWSVFLGNFSWSAESIPDITGDFQDDVVVVCRNDNLYVLDGSNGNILLNYPMNSGMLQGATLANIIPDMDNNNSWEILGADDSGKIVALSGGVNAPVTISNKNKKHIPTQYELAQNYPNPFNPGTRIKLSLPEQSVVSLTVYNITGQRVATVINDKLIKAGIHEFSLDGRNFPSGVYFYRLDAENFTQTRKMILMK